MAHNACELFLLCKRIRFWYSNEVVVMKYMVDIDNTICYNENSNYEDSKPDHVRIAKLNELFDKGHEIHYWTARGGNSGIDWTELTHQQLKEWNAKHTSITMKKPVYDVWIDDRAINATDFFGGYELRSKDEGI